MLDELDELDGLTDAERAKFRAICKREGRNVRDAIIEVVREHLGVKPVRYRARWRGDGRGQAWRRWLAEEVRELRRQGFVCRFAENHRTDGKPKDK